MASYETVCFDLDRTLCLPTQDPEAVVAAAFDHAGISPFCTQADLEAAIPAITPAQTDTEFCERLFAEAARRAGKPTAPVTALAAGYLEAIDPTAVTFRPGARKALEYAQAGGNVALVTNGGRKTQTQKLRALGISGLFDAAAFTDPAAGVYPKPDTAPFERVLETLGTDPETAVHVGDSLRADVAGANAVGMDSAWVPAENATDAVTDHKPTYELPTLEAFETIF